MFITDDANWIDFHGLDSFTFNDTNLLSILLCKIDSIIVMRLLLG